MRIRKTGFGLLLVLSLVWGLVATAAPQSQARTETKKITLLKGEKYELKAFIGKFTSASSSKSSVIKIKKSSSRVVCTAKKAGKSTVIARMTGGTVYKYYFTVKSVKINCRAVSVHYTEGSLNTTSDVAVEVINKSGVYINSVTVMLALYDSSGAVLEQKEYTFYDLVPGAKIYKLITYYGNPVVRIESVGKFKYSRSSANVYSNESKKISVTAQVSGESMTVNIRNNGKKNASGSADVVFYNANGEVVYVRPCSFYLKPKEATSTNITLYGDAVGATYQIYTRAYARS
ncbi:MAG: hypothetical protein J5819_10760 [Eubacterium sp.]|nr:hypothetical protein [Eubacterium sp.]